MATACVSRSPSLPFSPMIRSTQFSGYPYAFASYVESSPSSRESRSMKGMRNGTQSGVYGSALIDAPRAIPPLPHSVVQDNRYRSPPSRELSVEDDSDKGDPDGMPITSEVLVSKTAPEPRLYADLDSLITRIKENVVIRDKAISTPLWVQVPRGYRMEEAISPVAFYKSWQDVQSHVKKRKRTTAILPKRLRRNSLQEPHGFRPQEVNGTGAVSLEDCRPSNLNNDIHPLLDRSHFDDVPDAIYDQLIPGLRLATMFLTQPICMQFWVTLALGHRSVDLTMSEQHGKTSQRIKNHVVLTQQRADSLIKRIKNLGESNRIHFRFKHNLASTRSQAGAWGVSDPICDYRGIQKEAHGQSAAVVRSIIRLHADYFTVAKKLSQLKYPEVSQKLRFNFQFAVLVMHELAHSIEGIHIQQRADQWIDWHTSRFYKEPYWLDWQSHEYGSELGRAWEETMFGGEVSPINNRVDGSHGIGTSDWPPRGSFDDSERRIWHTVSMDYIERLFQMETWQRVYDLRQWRIFNIPRDGATSLYLNYFTTMAQDEEERVAKEAIAELEELEKAQPAKKKRVTGSGKTEDHRLEGDELIDRVAEGEAQKPRQSSKSKRQLTVLNGTHGASSIMPESLPNEDTRLMLSPKTRKPSSRRRPNAKAVRLVAKAGLVTHELTALQRKFIEEQQRKDKALLSEDRMIEEDAIPDTAIAKEPTSELVKKIRARPTGLMDRYRQKKKTRISVKQVAGEQNAGNAYASEISISTEDTSETMQE